MEWGCMQALIDFDGWRKWKDFSQSNSEKEKDKKKIEDKKKKKHRVSLGAGSATSSRVALEESAVGA